VKQLEAIRSNLPIQRYKTLFIAPDPTELSWIKQHSVVTHFYRATLCESAVFAAARCPSVRPSVCPSLRLCVTFVHSIQTAEDIVKLLCRPGCAIILILWTPTAGTQL